MDISGRLTPEFTRGLRVAVSATRPSCLAQHPAVTAWSQVGTLTQERRPDLLSCLQEERRTNMEKLVWVWAFIIIGGPAVLAGALAWAKFRSAPRTRADDPTTASDDPSKGMPGHD
jgi:hypothetical protein